MSEKESPEMIEDTTGALMGDEENETDADKSTQGESASDFINDPTVIAYIEKAVHEGVKKALKGKPPKANTANATEQEAKQFERMTYKERLNLFKSNPQAYYKLTRGEI